MHRDDDPYALARRAADELTDRLGDHRVAVVLGSGWSDVATSLGRTVDELRLSTLPGVPAPTVVGHGDAVRSVEALQGGQALRVLVVAGRSHLYEGHSPSTVVHTVRAAVMAGCSTVVLTNAAGSLRPEVGVGVPVLISDQLNLTGTNPMCGPAPPGDPASRFVDVTDLYSLRLRDRVHERHPGLSEGVYAGLLGGSFETPAEIRMLRTLGADLVGMSTVLEAVAARGLGAEVVGVSLVTNLAAGLQPSVDHVEVLEAGHAAAGTLSSVLGSVLAVV
jgi:purine-nucleoside phosphorylase